MRAKKRATVINIQTYYGQGLLITRTLVTPTLSTRTLISRTLLTRMLRYAITHVLIRTSYTLVSKKNTRLTRFEIRMCFLQNV